MESEIKIDDETTAAPSGALVQRYHARIDGIPACGTGDTEAEAIRSLAILLGDFVKARTGRLAELRSKFREIAKLANVDAEELERFASSSSIASSHEHDRGCYVGKG